MMEKHGNENTREESAKCQTLAGDPLDDGSVEIRESKGMKYDRAKYVANFTATEVTSWPETRRLAG